MLSEVKCGKTHIQIFLDGICICTVRVEYAQSVKDVIEQQLLLKAT